MMRMTMLHTKYIQLNIWVVMFLLTITCNLLFADDFSSVKHYNSEGKIMIIVDRGSTILLLKNPEIKNSAPTIKIELKIDSNDQKKAFANYVKFLKMTENEDGNSSSDWLIRVSQVDDNSTGYFQRSSKKLDVVLAELIEICSGDLKLDIASENISKNVIKILKYS